MPRVAVFVAARFEVFEIRDGRRFDICLRREARHYSEWRTGIWTGFRHAAGSLYLVDPAVKYDHFAVEIGESTKAKIAVLQNRFDVDLFLIKTRNQGTRGRYLKQRVNPHAEILGQGGRDDRRQCPFGSFNLGVQRSL